MTIDRLAAHQAGMDGFAVKPIDVSRLFEEMASVLHVHTYSAAVEQINQENTSSVSIVDWQAGIALWGSKTRLITALNQFLDTFYEKYPLPDEAALHVDWDQALSSLHKLHGVAGNLALPGIAFLAGSLEGRFESITMAKLFREWPRYWPWWRTLVKKSRWISRLPLRPSLYRQYLPWTKISYDTM